MNNIESAIPVTDTKGGEWLLGFSRYNHGRLEAWWFVFERPTNVLSKYHAIPTPIFTDWWSE